MRGSRLISIRLRALTGRSAKWLRIAVVAAMTTALGVGAAQAAVVSAAIVVDAKTGRVLYSSNADKRTYPASLTKIMTLYMLFEALDSGRVTLSSRIPISKHAAAQPPSKLGLKPGQTIAVKDAILSLVTRSANDIAAAIGEYLSGTESGFGADMTRRARQLGMKSTTFRNASGLPNSSQVTTARDMAILGRAIQDRFPHHFHYFKTRTFNYRGQKIGNHNRLLGKVTGVDGIKTGYIRASGFNLVTSVNTDNRRMVAVVLGGKSGAARNERMAGLVKKYMSKTSTGPQVVARVLPTGAVYMANVPLPRLRPQGDGILTGAVTSVAGILPPEFQAQGDISDDVIAYVEVTPARVAAMGSAPSPGASETTVAAAVPADEPIAPIVPLAKAPSGWKIQIAATPSESSAIEMLERARATGAAALASAAPYTEPVVKDSTTLYRARFGGFADKHEARAACAHLTTKKFACYAIAE
ncbi:MAG: D-alanyl-D-alanine carboxypeptidase [Hyphomicrobiales bacterium]|nr:D-alanyl-D-alanine carboxypeptidase [Hyphomicrobiales bacterium]